MSEWTEAQVTEWKSILRPCNHCKGKVHDVMPGSVAVDLLAAYEAEKARGDRLAAALEELVEIRDLPDEERHALVRIRKWHDGLGHDSSMYQGVDDVVAAVVADQGLIDNWDFRGRAAYAAAREALAGGGE